MKTPRAGTTGFAVLAALALGLVGLFVTAAGLQQDAAQTEEVKTLRLGYFPNVTHAQAVIGVARGDFQAALPSGVELKTSVFNAGPSVIESLFAGHIDMAYIGPSPTLNGFLRSKGEEVRVVAGAAVNGVLIVANSKRDLKSLEDLRGKRIATPQLGNTQDISAKDFVVRGLKSRLKEHGGDTEILPFSNPDIEILFSKDQIDAAWLPEPWGSRLIDKGLGRLLAEEKDLWPQKRFALTNIIARRELLEQHPELVRAILTAHVKITRELQQRPESFAPMLNARLKELTGKTLPEPVMAGALKHVGFDYDPHKASFERFFEMGRSLKFLKADRLDTAKLIQTQPLEEALRALEQTTTATAAAPAHEAPSR